MANSRLKFRAWDEELKSMFNDEYGPEIVITLGGKIYEYDTPFTSQRTEHSRLILEQFTGLLDKNGVEIYEGDIVSFPERPDDMQPFVMRWDEMRRGWAFFSPQRAYEVIGNIHENPELLK